MIFLDYAAHTPASKEALDVFYETEINYPANPNSNHKLGLASKKRLDNATENIKNMLNLADHEIIYTSGATESNNLAIKGIAREHGKNGKHIITSYLEHSSVTGSIMDLKNQGYEVDFVDVGNNGLININHLKELLRNDTVLVSLCYVDSELGTVQNIDEIGNLLLEYPNCFFHVDATQAIGKIPIGFENIDLATISAHKFFGITGSGALVKKNNVLLTPLIHGGISTTVYRSGTPTLSLIVSMEKAMELAMKNMDENYRHVKSLNDTIKTEIKKYKNVDINTPDINSPYIINISIKGIKSADFQRELEDNDIYISTKSACCAVNTPSRPVYAITKDRKRALSALRISLSHKTTDKEIDDFLVNFEKCYKKLIK